MIGIFSGPFHRGRTALGLLILRLGAGLGMALHGWDKITSDGGWMGWMGTALPGWLQGVATAIEFGGGLALLLGFLTPLAGLLVGAQMVAAYALVHGPNGDPFVGGYETAALYFCSAMLLTLAGPGWYAVDRLLWGRKSETGAATVRRAA